MLTTCMVRCDDDDDDVGNHNNNNYYYYHYHYYYQHVKKVVSDSPGLIDFAIRQVSSVINLPDGQMKFFRYSNYRRTVKSILLIKMYLGLVELTFGLVYASFRLPEWLALKMTFFPPCIMIILENL